MEVQHRKLRSAPKQDQENVFKGKTNAVLKRNGLSVRGALGDINTNVLIQFEPVGKVAVASAELEKKIICNRTLTRSNYSHVGSKVDTGLSAKNPIQPTSRPPLRREESTAGHAAKAAARNRAVLKESIIKPSETKKCNNETKKTKLPAVKEQKESKQKQVIKDPVVSLGKLKLGEPTLDSEKKNKLMIINEEKLKNIAIVELNSEIESSLPQDIEDVDAKDTDPFHLAVYIKDIYTYLTELEEKYPVRPNFLSKQTEISGRMRATLVDWLVEIQHQFSLMLETFQMTVGIIDRYLQITPNVQRKQLQLIGVTAMFIASKYEEVYAPDISDFVHVTADAYTMADVFQCERMILKKLKFCLSRPVPLHFVRRFIKVCRGESKNHHLAKYLVDLCLIEYSMAHYHPSELAAAAVCLSLYLLSGKKIKDVWTPNLTYYSGYSYEHIDPIIRKIANIVINVDKSKFKAVYQKYLEPTLAKVSSLSVLKSEAIYNLALIPSSIKAD